MADLLELNAALAANVEGLVRHLAAGRLVKRQGRELRVGTNGSVSVVTSGPKIGSFINHETGKSGGLIHYIADAQGLPWGQAVEFGRNWAGLGHPPEASQKPLQRHARDERAEHAKKVVQAREDAARTRVAAKFWKAATPLPGTAAERYLVETRRIPAPAPGWPQCVKFHLGENALIVAGTTDGGAVEAVQLVRLTPDAHKIPKTAAGPMVKQSYGHPSRAPVRLPGPQAGPVLFAEGPETGLSVWAATGFETFIGLGSIGNLKPLPGRVHVLCRDDDPQHCPADKAHRKLVREWTADGHNVIVATPWAVRQFNKSDFNHAIQAGGVSAVSQRINAALNPNPVLHNRMPVEAARSYVEGKVKSFFDEVRSFHGMTADNDGKSNFRGADLPGESTALYAARDARMSARTREGMPSLSPAHAIKADTGIGKSQLTRQHIAPFLAELRANGDTSTVVLAVPTHKLGTDQAIAFEALPAARATGLTARVWRGRKAADPDAAGKTMCQNLEAVADAQDVLADVQTTVCKTEVDGKPVSCPFAGVCGYQRQRAADADLWIVPHDLLFTKKPAALGVVAALVVDESCWQDGLIGAQGKPLQLSLDAIAVVDRIGKGGDSEQRLAYLRHSLLYILRQQIDGPVDREALLAAGFTAEMAAQASQLEWMRKVTPKMLPDMSPAERREAKHAAASNRTLGRFQTMWRAVESLLSDGGAISSGWLELAHDETADGKTRVLRLKGRRGINKGFAAPALLIDATLQLDLVRPIWPQITMTGEVAVDAPFQHVTQIADRSFSKRSLVQSANNSDADNNYRKNQFKKLYASLCAIARNHATGKVLVVAQQDVELALTDMPNRPGNIELAHHNAVAGRDEWKDVACLVVIGRTQAPPAAVTRLAEALTGSHIPLLDGWYTKADRVREMTDGSPVLAEADHHPDPIAEAVRWSICEGELMQIIGRGRGVNRNEENPLDVFIMTDVPLPLPLGKTIHADDLRATCEALMLAEGGIAFESATAAAMAFPDLWPTAEAAKKAMQRERLGTFPYNNYIYGNVPNLLSRVSFQLEGAGRSPTIARFDPEIVPDPVAWIVQRLGPVKGIATIDRPSVARAADNQAAPRTDPAGIEPANIYTAPMIVPLVSDSFVVRGGRIESRPALLFVSPKADLAPGQILIQTPHAKDCPIIVEWLDDGATLIRDGDELIDLAAQALVWGSNAKRFDWGPNDQVYPSRLTDLRFRELRGWIPLPRSPAMGGELCPA